MEPVRPDIATRSATPGVAIGNASARDTFAKRMAIDVSVVRDLAALRALEADWRTLAAGVLFRGPDWLIPWWLAYHNTLGAELHVLVGRATEADAAGTHVGDVVCLAPLYRRTVKVALLDTRELRMMGDAGPRPPSLDLLCRAGWEDRAGTALAKAMIDDASWDLIELEPLADPSRLRAHLVQRLGPAGFSIESSPSAGGAAHIALSVAPADTTDGSGIITTYCDDLEVLRKGMSILRRLSRLEWSERDEPSPLADNEASSLLEEVALALAKQGKVRLARLDDATGEAVAAVLVIDDADHAVILAMAVDPQVAHKGAPQRLLHAEAMAARSRGMVALDVVTGAGDYPLPTLPTSRQQALAVRIWGHSAAASVGRTYSQVARRARRARETPSVAAAQARAAWTKIRSAAASVAQYDRYVLYRGQLWTHDIQAPPGLELAAFTEADYDKLDEHHRADLVEQLALDELAARKFWRRGDHAVLAKIGIRHAGVAWFARGPVEVPELHRTLQMMKYDAYIHSVFVSPAARGRGVAPVMLEQITKQLRATDAYRSWALISSHNQASIRAFQKASFTPVCDVIHAKMATVDRVVCRPPDPEAKELLGLESD
jgi:GNAT superfamily N-acetyltransferase